VVCRLGVLSWGGCRVIPSSPSSVVVSCCSPPSSHRLALAPHIHPASSCSRQWCGHPLALLPVYPPCRGRLPSPSSLSPFPSVVTIVAIVPPVIHPMGSCSWGWGWVVCRSSPWVVLGRFLSFGVVLAVVFLSSLWVLGPFLMMWGPGAHFRHRRWVVLLSALRLPCRSRTPYSPREQLLTAVVGGAGCRRCCGVGHGWSYPVCRSPVVIPLFSLFHPMSSCLQGWRRVVVMAAWCRCRHRHSTRDPPHEQWLVRLGAGGML
jgi:hypothetical protein